MKKLFFKDIYIRVAYIGTALLLAIAFSLALSVYGEAGVLVIHFTDRGIFDFFGSPSDVLGIVGVGFAIALINGCLSYFFYDRERFFARLVPFFTLFLSTLILIAVGVIININ